MSEVKAQSIYRGYPFDGVLTEKQFPNRIQVNMSDDGHVFIDWKNERFKENFPEAFNDFSITETVPKEDTENSLKSMVIVSNFCLDRLFEYDQALKLSEQQIKDMMVEYPFIPEDHGFVENEKIGLTIDETGGVKWYIHSKNKSVGLARRREWDTEWILRSPNLPDGLTIKIENAREAYTIFKSLRVPIDIDAEHDVFSIDALPDSIAEKLKEVEAPKQTESNG